MTSNGHRVPSTEELSRERAFKLTNMADSAVVISFIVIAIASGSLTMLSEAVRGVLLLSVGYYTLWLLHAVHRQKLSGFQFGTGKVEQFAWVIVGVSLVVAALWVARSVFEAVAFAGTPASPLGLALAAIVNAVNLTINILGYWSMRNASRGNMSGVLGAEMTARFNSLVGSAILQITLTVAALAKDPGIVLLFDALGATLVVVLMIRRGIGMFSSGLGSLFDGPVPADVLSRIKSEIDAHLPPESLVDMRTRKGGDRLFVELGIDARSIPTIDGLNRQAVKIRKSVSRLGTPVDIVLVAR